MKHTIISMVWIALLCIFTSTSAIYNPDTTYKTQADFEASGDAPICESATDGCNTYFMNEDGTVGGGTRMYCEAPAEWSCTKFKEDIMFMTAVPTLTSVDPLTENDRNFYETIQDRLEQKYQGRVTTVVVKFDALLEKMSEEKQQKIRARFVTLIDEAIWELIQSYPQDIALPEDTNNLYYMLSLLKFEMLIGDSTQ